MAADRSLPSKEELWRILIETVHALPTYKNHKRYVSEILLKEKPEISSKELAVMIDLSLGEAIVILEELTNEKNPGNRAAEARGGWKAADHSLLDYNK